MSSRWEQVLCRHSPTVCCRCERPVHLWKQLSRFHTYLCLTWGYLPEWWWWWCRAPPVAWLVSRATEKFRCYRSKFDLVTGEQLLMLGCPASCGMLSERWCLICCTHFCFNQMDNSHHQKPCDLSNTTKKLKGRFLYVPCKSEPWNAGIQNLPQM